MKKKVSLEEFVMYCTDLSNKINADTVDKVNKMFDSMSKEDKYYADLLRSYWYKHPVPEWN